MWYILNGKLTSCHSCHSDKTTYFNHIRQHPMSTAMQTFHSFNSQQIRCNTGNLRPHAVQHTTKLLQIRFTSCVINGRFALRQDRSHHNISRTGNRSFIQQHISTFQMLCANTENTSFLIIIKTGSQLLNTDKVSVQTPTANLVTARLWNQSLSKTGNQRTNQHDWSTQTGTFL